MMDSMHCFNLFNSNILIYLFVLFSFLIYQNSGILRLTSCIVCNLHSIQNSLSNTHRWISSMLRSRILVLFKLKTSLASSAEYYSEVSTTS